MGVPVEGFLYGRLTGFPGRRNLGEGDQAQPTAGVDSPAEHPVVMGHNLFGGKPCVRARANRIEAGLLRSLTGLVRGLSPHFLGALGVRSSGSAPSSTRPLELSDTTVPGECRNVSYCKGFLFLPSLKTSRYGGSRSDLAGEAGAEEG